MTKDADFAALVNQFGAPPQFVPRRLAPGCTTPLGRWMRLLSALPQTT
jgi:predicted nuclease of predicted toxin-antitoxin system